jgi:hypothetical protein
MTVIERVCMDQAIDFTGRGTHLDVVTNVIHQLGIELPSRAHFLALVQVQQDTGTSAA